MKGAKGLKIKNKILIWINVLLIFTLIGCSNTDTIEESKDNQTQEVSKEDTDVELASIKADAYESYEGTIKSKGEIIYFDSGLYEDNRVIFIEKDVEAKKTTYSDLIRHPQDNIGKMIEFSGKVANVLTEDNNYYVLAMTSNLSIDTPNHIIIEYTKDINDPRIIQGDKLLYIGYSNGIDSFTNNMNQNVMLPVASIETMIPIDFNIGSLKAKAVKDFNENIVYAINYNGDFLTAFNEDDKIIWEYKEYEEYNPKEIDITEDGNVIVKGIKLKNKDDSFGETIETDIIFDKNGKVLNQ